MCATPADGDIIASESGAAAGETAKDINMIKYIVIMMLIASTSFAEDLVKVDEVLVCKESESTEAIICEIRPEYTPVQIGPKSDYVVKAAPAIAAIVPVARIIVIELSKVMTVEMIKELILHKYKEHNPSKPTPIIRSLTLKSH